MRKLWCCGILAVALLSLLSASAPADVITLTDGSRIVGTVERLGNGKLTLVTKFAGTIEIDASLVQSIATDETVNVGMTTGDRLVGPIEWKAELDHAVIQTELGGIPIKVDQVEAIWPEGAKSPEELALEEQTEQARKEMEALRAKWELTFEFGMSIREGNTKTSRFRGGGELRRRSPKDLLKFYVYGTYSEENYRRSESEVRGGAYYEHLITERWFAFARTELEYDEFENLDLRLSTGAGVGYYWLKEDHHELKTRAGIGYLHESYMDDTKRNAVEAELGLDYRLDISKWLQFTQAASYFPTLERGDDYRLVSDTAFLIPLGDSEMWKIKFGARYQYRNRPSTGFERLDQRYYANIVLDLK